MSQKTYMYDTQWTALINAIQGGDPTAIVTALGQIKTSIDSIETALGSLSADVTQDSTQWSDLITAIGSGGGGGGGTVDIDATQWSDLLTYINKADMSTANTALGNINSGVGSIATALGTLNPEVDMDSTQWASLISAINSGDTSALSTALTNIKSSLDDIYTRLNAVGFSTTQWASLISAINSGDTSALSTALTNIKSSLDNIYTRLNAVGFNTTQWTNLVNAITNQSLTVDLSNVTSSVVSNLSNVSGSTTTDAINSLSSDLTILQNIYQYHGAPASGTNLNTLILNGMHIYQIGNISIYSNAPSGKGYTGIIICIHVSAYILQIFYSNSAQCHRYSYDGGSTWNSWI